MRVPGARDHDLVQLGAALQLTLSGFEEDLLRRLSHFVEYAGRYPMPKNAEKLRASSTYWATPTDQLLFDALVSRLAASLREIPEVDFSRVRIRRNPYAARIAKEGLLIQVGRGRPKKLLEVGGTRPRSVRFSDAVWKQIEVRARLRGLTVHAALREAILAWLRRAA